VADAAQAILMGKEVGIVKAGFRWGGPVDEEERTSPR